jgi:hypothetical protein
MSFCHQRRAALDQGQDQLDNLDHGLLRGLACKPFSWACTMYLRATAAACSIFSSALFIAFSFATVRAARYTAIASCALR